MAFRSDEYGEGPKGPASTGEEAEMGFEAKTAENQVHSLGKGLLKRFPVFFGYNPYTFQGLEVKRSRSFCTMGFYPSDRYLIFGWSCVQCSKAGDWQAPRPPPGPPPALVRELRP